jgi:heat shock protein HslJ
LLELRDVRSPALLLIFFIGCTSIAPAALDLPGTEWILTEMRGAPPIAGSRVTLRFERDSAGGYSGCNWYGGDYDLQSSTIKWGDISQTMRGCLRPAGVQEQEQSYQRALHEAVVVNASEDRLTLKSANGEPLLKFARRVPAAVDPAQLLGRWRLRTIDGAPPSAPNVVITFAPGTITGFAGCRDFTSTYTARGDVIRLSSTSMASTECPASEAVMIAEGDFTTHLSEAENYRITGDQLEITTAPGHKLVFER